MKLFAILALFFCSTFSHEVRLFLDAPTVKFPARTPSLLLNRLPKKIVDPTSMIRVAAKKHKVKPALVKSIVIHPPCV